MFIRSCSKELFVQTDRARFHTVFFSTLFTIHPLLR